MFGKFERVLDCSCQEMIRVSNQTRAGLLSVVIMADASAAGGRELAQHKTQEPGKSE